MHVSGSLLGIKAEGTGEISILLDQEKQGLKLMASHHWYYPVCLQEALLSPELRKSRQMPQKSDIGPGENQSMRLKGIQ